MKYSMFRSRGKDVKIISGVIGSVKINMMYDFFLFQIPFKMFFGYKIASFHIARFIRSMMSMKFYIKIVTSFFNYATFPMWISSVKVKITLTFIRTKTFASTLIRGLTKITLSFIDFRHMNIITYSMCP